MEARALVVTETMLARVAESFLRRVNRVKHGVLFDEAATVFLDPLAVRGADPEHQCRGGDADRAATL